MTKQTRRFLMSNTQNHHFGSLYQSSRSLARLELHFARGPSRNNRSNLLAANRNRYLRHQAADANRIDSSHQLVPSTYAADHQLAFFLRFPSGSEKQPVHFAFRNAVMSPRRPNAANLLLINPLLDGGKADPQL